MTINDENINHLFNHRQSKCPVYCCLKKEDVHQLALDVLEIFYPHFNRHNLDTNAAFVDFLGQLENKLFHHLKFFVAPDQAEQITHSFFSCLGELNDLLDQDAQAIFSGDPAATSIDEVLFCYPGFFAMGIHRQAHFFYQQKLFTFARILNEFAHQKTGIDIHPGATIGPHFCIDHGTGVVIGETTNIGEHVKLYQGVTLGALSVEKNMAFQKRHPTIEDHCVIYAHATILGGNTVIGHHSTIGGNVWATKSVPPHSVVYHKSEIRIDGGLPGQNSQEIIYEI
jgi:serine O-acetyltransferase